MTGHRHLTRRIKGPSVREGGQITCLECDAKENLLRKKINQQIQYITTCLPVETLRNPTESEQRMRQRRRKIRPSCHSWGVCRWPGGMGIHTHALPESRARSSGDYSTESRIRERPLVRAPNAGFIAKTARRAMVWRNLSPRAAGPCLLRLYGTVRSGNFIRPAARRAGGAAKSAQRPAAAPRSSPDHRHSPGPANS